MRAIPFPAMRSLALVFLVGAASLLRADDAPKIDAKEALQRLVEGNKRFVAGNVTHPNQSAVRRAEQAGGQTPFAVVLTCSDSRVSPEIYFDQGIGDLFVIRNAGNVIDDHVLGSIEYAVDHLHTPLIIVVGHQKCGACSAAVAGGALPGHIHSLVDSIAPALERVKDQAGDKVDNVVRANAAFSAEILRRVEPILSEAVKSGQVQVVAARYDLGTGAVELLP